MTTFKKLQSIRAQVARIPGLKSYKDFDIAVEIGYAQRAGTPLTLKQLLLLNIASDATVRRHLARMVRERMVIKVVTPNDHRTAHFLLSETTIDNMEQCLKKIHQTLCSDSQCGPHD
jgi:hypothetical protein